MGNSFSDGNYYLMLIASREDFEPATEIETQSALYTQYQRYPFFAERVAQIRGRFAPNNQKVAVWGCGFGYLVELLVAEGYDAFGFDASAYAINRGKVLIPSISTRLFVRNALVSGDMTPARRDAGLPGAQRFPLLVTEDMLTCLTDAEISTALANLRGISSANLLHIVTLLDPTAGRDPRINWKTLDQWRALLCPPDAVAAFNPGEDVLHVWNAAGEI